MVSPTLIRFSNNPSTHSVSKFGPKYKIQPNIVGITAGTGASYGFRAASVGGALFVAVLLFASGIPRVQNDVLQKIPLVGGLFRRPEIPASDNPF